MSAPGAFQQALETILCGLDGVTAYLDDIIIATSTIEENSKLLMKVFKRFHEYDLTINWNKCEIFKSSIKYLGHILDSEGIRPDPHKIEIIRSLPRPTNVSELRSFLGAVNYYAKFLPKMRQLRHPLDELLKNGVEYNWNDKCEKSFQNFKRSLASPLLLTHYNPDLPITVAADASMVGIGGQIFHSMADGTNKVIYHISRALSSTEKRYSQIEKEALAIVYTCTKFHKMIYGRKFTLLTDHKPLLAIFGSKKGIPIHTANRLQRWALTMMCYNFDIQYVNTKDFGNVDMLSRLINNQQTDTEDFVIANIAVEDEVKAILQENLDKLPVTRRMICDAIKTDPILQTVYTYTQKGWPQTSKNVNSELLPFFNRRESITLVDDCLMFAERLIVPLKFKTHLLRQLHRGHQGIERMKSIARSYIYWPNIDKDIANFVKQCSGCCSAAKSPIKTELSSWSMPQKVLERLHIDIAGPIRGHYYLVMVDAFSKWPEVAQLTTISSKSIVMQMEEFVSKYGAPSSIVSDNGTQFVSGEFTQFCSTYGIKHLTIPTYHPQSNGQAERFVDTIKRALQKAYDNDSKNDRLNLLIFLSQYRSTPNPNVPENKTPAEWFIGRKLRLQMDLLKAEEKSEPFQNEEMEQTYNKKHGARKRSFEADDLVHVKMFKNNKFTWCPGKIIEKIGSVMYNVMVEIDNKNILHRKHSNQLRDRF